jgi:hypothetical protein
MDEASPLEQRDRTMGCAGSHAVSCRESLLRWKRALAEHKAVGVRAVVVTHLGREPTRSELEVRCDGPRPFSSA